jgi:PPOX class probable F420-dependent enzyme
MACSTKDGKPLVVPICFTFDGSSIYSAIDEKPKSTDPFSLRRVLNIIQNPNVSLIVDEYSEDWRRLQYVLVNGTAAVLTEGREFDVAVILLRKKYRQYHMMKLEIRPIIEIKPNRIVAWRAQNP